MKKFISILLCALMVMSLFATVFAAPVPNGGTEVMSPYSARHTHSGFPYNATCNGTTQTWYCKCSCGAYFIETHPCPAGPHNPGHCERLPI